MLNLVGGLLTKRLFNRPIFVVGVGRSGTTALLGGINKHPQVLGARFEFPFLGYFSHIPYTYEFGNYRDWILHSQCVSKSYFDQQCRRLVFEVAFGKYYGLQSLARSAVRGGWHVFNKRFWCAKVYLDEKAHQGVTALYPKAKFINIVRNGCDVVQSRTKHKSFAQRDFANHCREWAAGVEEYRYFLNIDNGIRVYQEDLISTPETVYEKIFDLVGLPHHQASASFVRNTLIHPLDEGTKRGVDVKEELATRLPAYGDWNAEQRSIFKDICGEAMQEVGYDVPF